MLNGLKPKSEFSRNVLILMTGTSIAQAIPIAISPILTRIYTPEDFGVLALYIAIFSIVSVIATLRYELAIVQPKQDEDAVALVALSVIITLIISTLTLLGVIIFNEKIQLFFANTEIGMWLYLTPVSVLLTGLYQSLNYWNTRNKNYKNIAYSKVAQGIGASGAQVGLGINATSWGLIWGYLLGQFISLWVLLTNTFKQEKKLFSPINKQRIIKNALTYQRFPKYSSAGAVANNVGSQMPVIILSKFFDMAATGMFSLVLKVLNLPASLLSASLSQVLFQKIAKMSHDNATKKIQGMIIKLFFILLLMMVPFVMFIWFFGEDLFAFVFGEPWREAGTMATIIVIAVAIRFAVSPLSAVLAIERNVKLGVIWQFIYLITISITLYLFSSENLTVFFTAFVVHEIILYLLYLSLILKGAKHIDIEISKES